MGLTSIQSEIRAITRNRAIISAMVAGSNRVPLQYA